MRQVIESRFQGVRSFFADDMATPESVVAQERTEYERMHDLPVDDPDERERHYREQVENSPSLHALKGAMDEWCAVWFWPTDEASVRLVPTPGSFHISSPLSPVLGGEGLGVRGGDARAAVIERLTSDVKFFHWELAFPDVFTPQRSGFDAMIGNPPWDVMKPNSQEFFTEFDPLYRTYDKQAALRKQTELFSTVPTLADQWDEYNARFKALGNWARNAADPFDVALTRGREGEALKSVWERHREGRVGFADSRHPFRLLGSGKQNAYKLFCEMFWSLLRADGRLGVILPTGIYSDFGTKDLREELLLRGRLDFLYAFQNEKRVFAAAHHSFKQTVVLATRGGCTQSFRTRFRMGVGDSPEAQELPNDILGNNDAAMIFTPDDVRANSPKTLSLVELKSQRDLEIFRKIYSNSIRIGDKAPGWEISYAQEINMTSDSKHFPPLEKWEAKGYKPDVFGRWIGPDGEVALPLYQGGMVNLFDFSANGWLSGLGRSAAWCSVPFDQKRIGPKYLISEETQLSWPKVIRGIKLGQRRICRATDTRTLILCPYSGFGGGDTLATLQVEKGDFHRTLW